jgi:hypothetical protein
MITHAGELFCGNNSKQLRGGKEELSEPGLMGWRDCRDDSGLGLGLPGFIRFGVQNTEGLGSPYLAKGLFY